MRMKTFFSVFVLSIVTLGLFLTPCGVKAADITALDNKTIPRKLFDKEWIMGTSNLNLEILEDVRESVPRRKDISYRKIRVKFFAHRWHGSDFNPEVTIIIPDKLRRTDIALIRATRRVGPFLKASASQLGLVTAFIEDVNLGDHFGMRSTELGRLMSFGLEKVVKTEDLTWTGYYALSLLFMRTATALSAIPDLDIQKVILTGSSKWAMAAWISAGYDPRVIGIISAGWNIGNLPAHIKLREKVWTKVQIERGWAGPVVWSAEKMQNILDNPRYGKQYLSLFDPYFFKDKIKAKTMIIVGTNDPVYPLTAEGMYYPQLTNDKALLFLANVRHETSASKKNYFAVKSWISHIVEGRPIPRIDEPMAQMDNKRVVVRVGVGSKSRVAAVRLYYAWNQGKDFRGVTWMNRQMVKKKGEYEVSVPRMKQKNLAYFVEVEDQWKKEKGFFTSMTYVE